ncbi:MAG: HprK-related kinase A [Sulfuritalea sp.]|nr:HprK-related kinase A [Sulfuritalea sp.]
MARRLARRGVDLSVGSFTIRLRSNIPCVARGLELLYADYALGPAQELVDFEIRIHPPGVLRRWLRPQVTFSFEGHAPFKPLPRAQAFALFEWGLNWVIANNAHQYAIVHAATVEKSGRAVILPGMPGSGKSTLCAAMVCRGWRLLSDEMALISLQDGMLWPFPRPIGLKNASIDILRNYAETVVIGETVADTAKGTVAHMRPPRTSIDAARTPACARLLAFPTYKSGAPVEALPLGKAQALMRLVQNCFNYSVLGAAGFAALADTVDRCECLSIEYGNMARAIEILERRAMNGEHG